MSPAFLLSHSQSKFVSVHSRIENKIEVLSYQATSIHVKKVRASLKYSIIWGIGH